jgi:hypothetical protein
MRANHSKMEPRNKRHIHTLESEKAAPTAVLEICTTKLFLLTSSTLSSFTLSCRERGEEEGVSAKHTGTGMQKPHTYTNAEKEGMNVETSHTAASNKGTSKAHGSWLKSMAVRLCSRQGGGGERKSYRR